MSNQTVDVSVKSAPFIVGDGVRMENAKPTTNTAYKKGDLLILGASNVATLATDPAVWDAICGADMTAAQSTAHVTDGFEMPIYTQGAFSISAITLGGTALATNQYDAARARGTKNKFELRKVVGA